MPVSARGMKSDTALDRLRILALQPFAGGSHAAMLAGWRRHSGHDWTVLELPPVHWKWRMRHGPLTLADQARRAFDQGAKFDLVFCTDMLPVHEWRGLVGAPLAHLPLVVYFHENQLTYPTSDEAAPDLHYGYTNLLTLIAADAAWFNSEFHRREFQRAALDLLARMPDYRHADLARAAFDRAHVCPPGIESPMEPESPCHLTRDSSDIRPLRIGWVGRWEHDKRPDRFAEAIDRLANEKLEFELVLLGQRFRTKPAALQRIIEQHGDRVVFDGYAESRQEYWERLSEMDIVVSTADHEFFGIAIAEAVAAGALPLVPERLAYPELLGRGEHPELATCFYDGTSDGLVERLTSWLSPAISWPPSQSLTNFLRRRMQGLSWERLAPDYDQKLQELSLQSANIRR